MNYNKVLGLRQRLAQYCQQICNVMGGVEFCDRLEIFYLISDIK